MLPVPISSERMRPDQNGSNWHFSQIGEIGTICSTFKKRVSIIEMELMPDHVHLLLEVDPQFGIHKAVKQIKGRTSRILRQEFPELRSKLPTLWTNSYFVSTVIVQFAALCMTGTRMPVIIYWLKDWK